MTHDPAVKTGYYCEHGYDIGLDDYLRAECPHGCTETVPLCGGCGHELHSSGRCVMSCNCRQEGT